MESALTPSLTRTVRSLHGTFADWRPSVVMFDLDGTLIDTMGGFADLAAELINRDYGTERVIARKRYLETSGIPFRQQLELVFPKDGRNDAVAAEYEQRKGAVCARARIDADTLWMLELLRSLKIRVVVSSNSAQHFVDQFQQKLSFSFDLALGFGDGLAKGEPHVELVCRRFGVSPDQILFVGDSLKDAELARRCGQRFVARVGTFRHQDFTRAFSDVSAIDRISDLRFLVLPCK